MKTLILVGGASASGKSSYVSQLNGMIDGSLAYRRVQAFFDKADALGVDRSETFKYVTSVDADDWFVDVCSNHEWVISDIHYALQMARNFKMDNSNADIYQEYVPTISKSLLEKLLNVGVRVVAVHLTCSEEVLYDRAIARNKDGLRELRAVSLEDVKIQASSERREWMNVANTPGVYFLEINSELSSPSELSIQTIDFISSIKDKGFSRKREKKDN